MENISTQMRKGILEYIILGIISQQDRYGGEIIEHLKIGNMIVAEGTIYPLLSRLRKDGYIDYYRVESDSGHPRKYYCLTPDGNHIYSLMEQYWYDIKTSVDKILHK